MSRRQKKDVAEAGGKAKARLITGPQPAAEVHGELPGDASVDFFWEARVAGWLGVPCRRVSALRRKAMAEGKDWRVHDHGIVYTKAGIALLESFLKSLGVQRAGAQGEKNTETTAETPPVPQGPPERKAARVVRLFPNRRLLLARPNDTPKDKPVDVLVIVRDNTNFLPGMSVTIVHDARGNRWQFSGRLPRRKGKW